MSISVNLSVISQLDTSGGPNVPSPTDTYNSTASLGTHKAGPMDVTVTETPALVPLALTPTAGVYWLCVANTGASAMTLNMINFNGNWCPMTISAGGRVYFHNVVIGVAQADLSDYSQWTLHTAMGLTTTASVSLIYT